MSDPVTPDTVDQSTVEDSDLWTADSERAAIQTSDDAAPVADQTLEAEPANVDAVPSADRDEKGKFKPGRGKPRSDPQARVEAATAKEAAAKEDARIAREEAAQLRADLERLRSLPAQTAQPAESKPSQPARFQFLTFDQWLAGNPEGDWDAYQDAKLDARDSFKSQVQHVTSALESHQRRLADATNADPAFASALQSGANQIVTGIQRLGLAALPPLLVESIVDSPQSVEILRHLVTHPDVAIQLAVETKDLPASAAPVVRRLLASSLPPPGAVPRADSASVVRPSNARPPINRVGGTASVPPADPDDLEFGPEFLRAENLREKAKREASRW